METLAASMNLWLREKAELGTGPPLAKLICRQLSEDVGGLELRFFWECWRRRHSLGEHEKSDLVLIRAAFAQRSPSSPQLSVVVSRLIAAVPIDAASHWPPNTGHAQEAA